MTMQGHQNWLDDSSDEAARNEPEAYEQWFKAVLRYRLTFFGRVREANREIAQNLLPDLRPTATLAQEDIEEILQRLASAVSKLDDAHTAEIGAHLGMWPRFEQWRSDSEREPNDARI